MKCSGLSRWGESVGDDEDGCGEIGGSATEVSPPPQAVVTKSTGAVSAPASVRRRSIEAMPPETAVDVVLTVLRSRRLGEQVVQRKGKDVVVVREVHDLQGRAGPASGQVQGPRPASVLGARPSAAGARPEEREARAGSGQPFEEPGIVVDLVVDRGVAELDHLEDLWHRPVAGDDHQPQSTMRTPGATSAVATSARCRPGS